MAIPVLLLLLLVGEVSLRVYHQQTLRQKLPVELREETRALTWDEIKDKYRIVCLGDSITYGEDLPYAETYPAILADLLKQKHADLDAVVINSGVRGHTSVQGLARLERDVLWYKPHVVFIAFGLNDGRLGYWPLDPLRERQMRGDPSLSGRVAALLQRSHLWLTLRARTRRLLRRLGWREKPPEVCADGGPQPRVSREGFAMAQERMIEGIRENGCQAVFFMTATPVTEVFAAQLGPAWRQQQLSLYEEYNDLIRRIAAHHGVHLLDLHRIFASRQAELPSLLAEDGVHLTAAGERLVAQSALQALESCGLPGSERYRRR
ncbi:MAG: SGNH/GDSL hydrolase family protein [Chloroflexi bacterium]|nr:SGNH/GDSL hydrolase family protein [Chloroflexota bacterium]